MTLPYILLCMIVTFEQICQIVIHKKYLIGLVKLKMPFNLDLNKQAQGVIFSAK